MTLLLAGNHQVRQRIYLLLRLGCQEGSTGEVERQIKMLVTARAGEICGAPL